MIETNTVENEKERERERLRNINVNNGLTDRAKFIIRNLNRKKA